MSSGEHRDICDRAFEFARRIIRVCRALDTETSVHRTLGRQILRSGTSVGANLEEAQGSQSQADFISKCSIAAKEVRETHFWLRLLAAENLLDASRLAPLIQESDELVRILTTIVLHTKQRSASG